MSQLNEGFTFNAIANAEIRRAFYGVPAKESLKAGLKLYKWTEYPLRGAHGITPWWTLVDPLTLADGTPVPGLQNLHEWGARLGAHERDYARVRSAVTKQWNDMRRPLFLELIQPVWAWIGKASGQLEDQDQPNVFLIGGNYQVWLPNLTMQYVKQVSALPYLQPR